MRKISSLFLMTAIFQLFVCLMASANTDNRNWTLASGEKFTAILEAYDQKQDIVKLKIGEGGEDREYKLDDFSTVDKAWLTEWSQITGELDLVLKHSGGKFCHYQSQGQYVTDFYVYYPSIFTNDSRLPMFLMFHPSGKGARYNKELIMGAEATGVIVVTFDTFRNTLDKAVEDEELARFKEILPQIEQQIPHDPAKLFLGGMSGGAADAYMYSSNVKRPWAGIFSNGGWLGGEKNFDKPYPSGMKIAMVNGNNDGVNRWVDIETKILTDKGDEVRVFSFQGAHQVAPPMVQTKAFLWLIGKSHDETNAPAQTN